MLDILKSKISGMSPSVPSSNRLPDPVVASSVTPPTDNKSVINVDGTNRIGGIGMEELKNSMASRRVAAGVSYKEKDHKWIKSFYDQKTVLPNNLFYAAFQIAKLSAGNLENESSTQTSPFVSPWYSKVETSAMIQPWHIKSVQFKILPTPIEEERVLYIPFPTIDVNKIDYSFTVTFEEDTIGTIFNFIQWCYHRVVDMGFYHYTNNNRIGNFSILVFNAAFDEIQQFDFKDVFLKDAGDLSLNYESGTPRNYTCTFGARTRVVQTISLDTAIAIMGIPILSSGNDSIIPEVSEVDSSTFAGSNDGKLKSAIKDKLTNINNGPSKLKSKS